MKGNEIGREALKRWEDEIRSSPLDADFMHTVSLYRGGLLEQLGVFHKKVLEELEPLVIENNLAENLPRLQPFDGIGNPIQKIVHHPTYEKAGNIIYSSRILERLSKPGSLLDALSFLFISSQAGESGHNCPLACSAGIIRVLQKTDTISQSKEIIAKLIDPSYSTNFTGAQFLTEVQGGSDVGLNATSARQDENGNWRITGEKWFCSNADAEVILLTARFNPEISGTKGLGLFLILKEVEGKRNTYTYRRLKDKIGTKSMASAEIDFDQAIAYPVGKVEEGFKLVMENVLHISRLFNTFCVLGMVSRGYKIAEAYAKHRIQFSHPIIEYPLVQENLAEIRAENLALIGSAFATVDLQDQYDTGEKKEETKLILRLLANLNKYISALWAVKHLHHLIDVLAGNGAIESFSTLPRLLRDSIVCENWEGTHNTLRQQILKDISRYQIDELFIKHIEPQMNHPILKDALQRLKLTLKDQTPLPSKGLLIRWPIFMRRFN